MAVAELMRILLDQARLGWDEAWDLTVRTLAYTNHTLLPEALEKWPVELFEALLPRHLEIIYEINRRFLDDVRAALSRRRGEGRADEPDRGEPGPPGPDGEPGDRRARTARTAWRPSTRSCSGPRPCADFAAMFPERFSNKTNGVTPRRWLLLANPDLAELLTEAVGDGWVTDLGQLQADRPAGRRRRRSASEFLAAKRAAKVAVRRLDQGQGRASRSTPTRSSTRRSSASTSTSGNC